MNNRDEVKAFLSSRRAKITPERAGLSNYSRSRRVLGLRRSEVADLAGVSVEYYAQLERGNLAGVSESVRDALCGALQLDEAEREHLLDLARAAGPARRSSRRSSAQRIRPSIARILQGMTEVPAFVENGRLDVLATNPLAAALYAPVFADPARPANLARFTFLNPQARTFWGDWTPVADDTVAMLRTKAGRDPFDKGLTDLVGELSTRSDGSVSAGAPTTWVCIAPGASTFTTPSWGTCICPTKSWNYRPTPASHSSHTAPRKAHPTTTRYGCWPAGPPPTSRLTPSPLTTEQPDMHAPQPGPSSGTTALSASFRRLSAHVRTRVMSESVPRWLGRSSRRCSYP